MSRPTAMKMVLALALAAPTGLAAAPARAEARPRPEAPPPVRSVPAPEITYAPTEPALSPGWAWLAGELVPSPALAFGDLAPSFGLRWQVTPVLWSFGVHRATSPWRVLVVDPIARLSGSIELHGTYDWFFGAIDDTLLRPGIRATFPLLHRGEYLAASIGTSIYDRVKTRVAYDAGIWILSGFVGASVTVAPDDARVRAIGTLNLRVLH
jgi:hypothetical protein